MHTLQTSLTTFHYNSDLSGMVEIIPTGRRKPIEVYGQDLIDFIAEYVRNKRITKLEEMESFEVFKL